MKCMRDWDRLTRVPTYPLEQKEEATEKLMDLFGLTLPVHETHGKVKRGLQVGSKLSAQKFTEIITKKPPDYDTSHVSQQ